MASAQVKKVIIAVDNSDQAEKAFDYYAKYLHKPMNKVLVLHAPELSNVTMRMMRNEQAPYENWNQMWAEEEKKWQVLKQKFEKKLADHNIPGSFDAEPANKPGEAIVTRANKEEATMIITGTRGLGSVRRKLMGSVSEYIVHHSTCPVIVCKN